MTQAEQAAADAEVAYAEAERLAAQAPGAEQVADALEIARQGVERARLGLERTRATNDAREQSAFSEGAGYGWARAEQGLALVREAVARTVERRAAVQNGTQVYGWDIAEQGLDCPPGFIVRVRGMSQKTDRAYWYATREEADAALKTPGFLASHGDQRESGSVHTHAGGPARRAWLNPIASVVPAAPPGHVIPEGLPVPLGSSPGPLHLTDEEVRMVTQSGCIQARITEVWHREVSERMARGESRAQAEDGAWSVVAINRHTFSGPETLQAVYVPADQLGWLADEMDTSGGAWRVGTGFVHPDIIGAVGASPVAKPEARGHVRLAWMALLGAVALLLAAPVAVADPPPRPRPAQERAVPRLDAGTPNFCPASNWPCDCPGNPDCPIKPG